MRALVQAGLGDQAWRLSINELWAECVGPNITKRTRVAGFSRGVLKIRVASAAWQQELSFLRVAIVHKLNQKLGAPRIKSIRVLGGHLNEDEPPEKEREEVAAQGPAGPHWGSREDEVGKQIACPEVRAAFNRLRRKQYRH